MKAINAKNRTWSEYLPDLQIGNEAWRLKHLPRLRLEQKKKNLQREYIIDLITRGLDVIGANDIDRTLVSDFMGLPHVKFGRTVR